MNRCYSDILSRVPMDPLWFDENAVPRYEPFSPDAVANIYAKECCLLRIQCQNCGKRFDVALSQTGHEWLLTGRKEPQPTLAETIRTKAIHYGDPPNVECCPSGPTMNSEPDRVLQFWKRDRFDWERDAAFEIDVWDEPTYGPREAP